MIKNKNLYKIIIINVILMFGFLNISKANYDKIFYDHSIKSIDGLEINLSEFKGKAFLLVNVASYCGFTKQYADLQKVWDKYKEKGLVVLGIPSRSFDQEKNTEGEVKDFCEVNFSITFPMSAIFDVKGSKAHEIYKWAEKNYGKKSVPKWNFHKILINRNGKIEDTFASFTNPNSNKIINAIEKVLN